MPCRSFVVRAAAVAALALSLWSGTAEAQTWFTDNGKDPAPMSRFVQRNSVFFRWNPIGFIHDGRFMFRQMLFRSDSAALADNYVAVGLSPSLSPAFGRIGAYVEFQPITLLTFYANYEVLAYFGGFNFLQSFKSANDDFSDSRLRTLANKELTPDPAQRNYTTTGTQLTLGANFQIKIGNVVARTQFRAVRPDYNLRPGDRVFYESVYDVMAPNQGWFMTNDADVLYQLERGPEGQQWTFGVRHTFTRMMFDARHFAEGETVNPDAVDVMNRVGPLAAYTFTQKNGDAWTSPTLTAGFQWWITSKFRTGRDVTQVMPLFLLGFSTSGDLLGAPGGK